MAQSLKSNLGFFGRDLNSISTMFYVLQVDGRIVLRFASAYGFRNIQTLLRKIKQGMCQYDYVEIMACPSGCTNGGGQIKARSDESAQEVIRRVEGVYHDTNKVLPRISILAKAKVLKVRKFVTVPRKF